MEKNPIYKVTIVYPNGNIEKNVSFTLEPKEGDTYVSFNDEQSGLKGLKQHLENEIVYTIVKSILTNFTSDNERTINYYTIYVEPTQNKNMIGVTQVKLITCEYSGKGVVADLESQLNHFLYETRHTHHIIDIQYTQYYIAVKYRIRNGFGTTLHKALEESYQKDGIKTSFIYNSVEWSGNETNIDYD